ncbi:MAG TPA: endonuclease/exonuclease/phosphatase family protein [Capsulimonadaceae bacterium]|jgi:endonuclease/exonuclease/phosphatase (EEP) superfamily protein YafD
MPPVIRKCRKCGKSNRLPAAYFLPYGRYVCGGCAADIGGKLPWWLATLIALWALVLGAISIANADGPEKWALGAINLYVPQWIYALPALVIIPLVRANCARVLWIPLVCLLYVLGPLMGFTWTAPADVNGVAHIRVMTFNAKWGWYGRDRIAREIKKFNPDIVQLQDARTLLDPRYPEVRDALSGYNIRSGQNGKYLFASRFPASRVDHHFFDDVPGAFTYTRVWVKIGKQGVAVYNTHLLTPRRGLTQIRHMDFDTVADESRIRLLSASKLVSAIESESGPYILTGDLNAPIQSLVCRNIEMAGARDAFSEAGRGYGYTYGQSTPLHMPYVRIDHIFVSSHWKVTDCTVGGSKASEHSPVRAVLALTGR